MDQQVINPIYETRKNGSSINIEQHVINVKTNVFQNIKYINIWLVVV